MGVLPPLAGHGGGGDGRGSWVMAGKSRWCQARFEKKEEGGLSFAGYERERRLEEEEEKEEGGEVLAGWALCGREKRKKKKKGEEGGKEE